MKTTPFLAVTALAATLLAAPALRAADDDKKKTDAYPLDTCVVTDEKLGSMGKPYVYEHEGRQVQFCCKGCLKDFKKDPAKYMKKLDDAEKAAKAKTDKN
ncbi:MAG TPA: TRASH domain-containing protein [Verrucomicrobiota bacterium]|nr:TRASH domain-containing protein [Verrucomicrobiota bacterium]